MPRFRGNGEGTISKRCRPTCTRRDGKCVNHKGLWQMRIYNQNGERSCTYYKTEREAKEALKAAQRAKDDGMPVMPAKHTMAELFTEWLEAVVKTQKTYGTYRSYRSHVHEHLIPAFGRIECRALTVKEVETYLALPRLSKRTGQPLSARSKQYHRAILRRALNVGTRWGWVSQNVVKATDAPPQSKSELPVLSIEEAEALLQDLAKDSLYDLYLVALWTGLRVGEVAGIRWEDLDLSAGRLHVRKQVQRIEGRLELVEPKTQASKAIIDLQPDTVEMFRERQRTTAQPDGLVFVTKSGKPYDPVYITHRFQAALRKAGRQPIPFHHLRHYFVSFLPQLGIHPAVAQKLARHANMATTMSVYTGVTEAMQHQATEALSRARRGAAGVPTGVQEPETLRLVG